MSAGLGKAALWALERGAEAGESVCLTANGHGLTAHWRRQTQVIAVPFEVSRLRQRNSADFRALLAVHEAGHGLVHAQLFGRAPQEIKIHVASFEGRLQRLRLTQGLVAPQPAGLHLHQPGRPRRRTAGVRRRAQLQRR